MKKTKFNKILRKMVKGHGNMTVEKARKRLTKPQGFRADPYCSYTTVAHVKLNNKKLKYNNSIVRVTALWTDKIGVSLRFTDRRIKPYTSVLSLDDVEYTDELEEKVVHNWNYKQKRKDFFGKEIDSGDLVMLSINNTMCIGCIEKANPGKNSYSVVIYTSVNKRLQEGLEHCVKSEEVIKIKDLDPLYLTMKYGTGSTHNRIVNV